MSSAESSADTVKYMKRLLAEREDLQAASDRTASTRRSFELGLQSVGQLSRMGALRGQAKASDAKAHWMARLRDTKVATAHLNFGKFGYYTDCGEPNVYRYCDLAPVLRRCISGAQ